jgi:hypothetical protein
MGQDEDVKHGSVQSAVGVADRSGAVARWIPSSVAPAVAAALAVTAVVAGWRGTDLAAQVFRADLVKQYGIVLWNGQWFGGHATLSYSVLTPVLSALVGPVAVAIASGVVGAVLFERLARHQLGATSWLGAAWFGAGTAANVVVGRVPFALGMALGLAAMLALQRRLVVLAAIAALLTTLASPVAGVFVVIGGAAWALGGGRQRWWSGALVAAAVLLPLAVLHLVFPGDGFFPYEPWAVATDVALAALCFALASRAHVTLRIGAVLYASMAVLAFAVPNPLGGNISRFSQFFVGPILACLLWPRRKLLVGLLAAPLLAWQWTPALQTIVAPENPTEASRSYFEPVVEQVLARTAVPGRMEIPVTVNHWESAYVADRIPLARGWERQLDLAYNPVFYDGSLDAASYERWLIDNGVQFVALPDAALDDSSATEARLLASAPPYLDLVWSSPHWQLWRVRGYQGLISGPATVVRQDATGFQLQVEAPGDVILRARPSPHWHVDGEGCVGSTDDGWTLLKGLQPGTVDLTQQWRGSSCA